MVGRIRRLCILFRRQSSRSLKAVHKTFRNRGSTIKIKVIVALPCDIATAVPNPSRKTRRLVAGKTLLGNWRMCQYLTQCGEPRPSTYESPCRKEKRTEGNQSKSSEDDETESRLCEETDCDVRPFDFSCRAEARRYSRDVFHVLPAIVCFDFPSPRHSSLSMSRLTSSPSPGHCQFS